MSSHEEQQGFVACVGAWWILRVADRAIGALATSAAILFVLGASNLPAYAQEQSLVHRIDHIAVVVPDPGAVDELLTLFRDELGLPVWFDAGARADAARPAWDFYNTAFYLGNVFFEFITFRPAAPATHEPLSARYYGFAFESHVDDVAAELDARGIRGPG